MIILFDGSGMKVTLTVVGGESSTEYEWEAGRTLAKELLAYLHDTLAKHSADFSDLTGIGVFQGPGSYTGLRISLTVLNTLAESLNIPIVGAVGDDWRHACLQRLSAGQNDGVVLPHYGGEAHITAPAAIKT